MRPAPRSGAGAAPDRVPQPGGEAPYRVAKEGGPKGAGPSVEADLVEVGHRKSP
jgi:hypothetical protein